jgi:hypothetical protein
VAGGPDVRAWVCSSVLWEVFGMGLIRSHAGGWLPQSHSPLQVPASQGRPRRPLAQVGNLDSSREAPSRVE